MRQLETRYQHGQRHGETSHWYKSGQQARLENYLQGKPHGTFKSWHQEGKLAAEVRYENGERK